MMSWLRTRSRVPQHPRRTPPRFRPRVENLEDRCLLAAPTINTIANQTLPTSATGIGKSLVVPVTGAPGNGSNALNYTVSSDSANVTAQVLTGNTFLQMNITTAGNAAASGTLVFELFNNFTPNAVARITSLVNSGFYNGLTIYRAVNQTGFQLIQGGNRTGQGPQFNDEFNQNLIFNGTGQLAWANSGDDTNTSEFFVTVDSPRVLDFNFTLFGQLLSGQSVVQAVDNLAPASGDGQPTQTVTITSASIITDTHDAVLLIHAAPGATTPAHITVTATDAVTSESSQRMFTVTPTADTVDDPPILGPTPNQVTTAGQPVTFPLSSIDLQGNPVTFEALVTDSPATGTATVNGNQVTFTPKPGFTGTANLKVGVARTGATSRSTTDSDPFDTNAMQVTVGPAVPTPGPHAGADTNQAFLINLWHDLLNRDIDSASLTLYGGELDQHVINRFDVIQGVTGGLEYRIDVVQGLFNKLLQRAADPTGMAQGVAALAAGESVEEYEADLMSTPEYFQKHGNNNTSFVQAVYQDGLGRTVSASDVASQIALVNQGMPRKFLALGVLESQEGLTVRVQNYYAQLLDRPADPSDKTLTNAVMALSAGMPDEVLITLLASGQEYFNMSA